MAGVTVYKTLDQWKAENPGVAETLVPYGFKDKRGDIQKLANGKSRFPLSDRFAYDRLKVQLFLSVSAIQYELIDRKNEVVLIQQTSVFSGNSGGMASGGAGWWAFWLVHKTPRSGEGAFFDYVELVKTLGAKR